MTAATLLYAEPEKPLEPQPIASEVSVARHFTEPLGARTAKGLIGQPVEGPNGDTLGKVNDFVLDPRTGEIVFVVIASGGFADIGVRLRPVPPQAISPASAKRGILSLDVTPKHWKTAPRMNKEKLEHLSNASVAEKIYAYYGQPWPWTSTIANESSKFPAGHLALASELIGESIINPRKGEIGRVSDLGMNLREHAPARVIVSPIGTDEKAFSLPMNFFETDREGNRLLLNTDMRAYQSPHSCTLQFQYS